MPRVAEELRRPWKSAIPTLLLSGERDPVTPPAYGVSVARNLSRSRHVVFRGGGHAENSWCKLQLIVAFLEAPGERRLDVSCADLDWFPGFREE
jgi:pimeloyl-ACP methyl ester carboxylesterase